MNQNLTSDKISLRDADMTGGNDGYNNQLGFKTSYIKRSCHIFRRLLFITKETPRLTKINNKNKIRAIRTIIYE